MGVREMGKGDQIVQMSTYKINNISGNNVEYSD